MKKSVGIITLGCDKNRVDTEHMLFGLAQAGFDITNDYANAQILIVNTCAFIESARKEAIDVILAAAAYKKQSCEKLIVTGCLPQKFGEELRNGLPEVDCFLGIDSYDNIHETIRSLYNEQIKITQSNANPLKRIITTPLHYAYLKIADGCNNHCTFCTIPSIRGAYRSKPIEALVEEARMLSEQGVKELILVAQDVTKYGYDLYGESKLRMLIRKLTELANVHTLRLLYCYPESITDELIEEIANNPKVADYIDIPIQHIDDSILQLMNRRSRKTDIQNLFRKLRNNRIAVRTTVMVGFPQETQENFDSLCNFIMEYKPEHVGIFAYSKETGTPAAKLKGQISKTIKTQRVNKIGKLHLHNREKYNQEQIGRILQVIYEDIDYEKGLFVGRSQYDAPDIDTKVYFTADFVEVGEYYNIKITGFEGYDLIGEKV